MDLETIKAEVAEMSQEQQDHLAAYLVHLRHRRETARPGSVRPEHRDEQGGHWIPLDQLKEQWKD